MADGLAQSNVMDIKEDRRGNLWMATFGGLSRFNGISFENYDKQDGLASNRTFCLSFDSKDALWIGTSLGISSFDGRDFTNYTVPHLAANQWVNHLLVDKEDHIWFGTTAGGLYQINTAGEVTQILDASAEKIALVSGISSNGNDIYVTTYHGGLYRVNDKESTLEQVSLPPVLNNVEISSLYTDTKNNLWLGTSKGLFYSEGLNFEWVHSFHEESVDFAIYSINEEYDGTIWLGTTHGAYKFKKGLCTSVKATEGLTDNIVYKIHRDREGTLWYGTFGGGVYKSLGDLFTYIGKNNGMNFDYVSSISKGKNNYWFGSYGGGVYRYVPGTAGNPYIIDNLSSEDGLSNNFVFAAEEDDQGNLWVATAWGLSVYDGKRFKNFYKENGLPSNQIYTLIKGSNGSIYCGTSQGIAELNLDNNRTFKSYEYPGAEQHNRVRSLEEIHGGNILMGTQGGLKIFNGKEVLDYFEADSLKHIAISSIYQHDDGTLWVGLVDEGILYYNPSSKKVLRFTEASGLSSNIVYSLAMDKQGSLWVGTPRGLDKVSFDNNLNIESVRNFAANEGFFGIETNTNALMMETDGSIWFGTVAGAYICHPEKDVINPLEPITFLTGVRLFSKKVDWKNQHDKQSWSHIPEDLSLNYDQNHLTFEYSGNSLKNAEKVRYQYMLENFDRGWQPITKRKEAVYTNLPPGAYTFKIKASNNDGIWNDIPITYSFEIKPPFWRTWWFFTLAFVAIGVVGRLYYNFRVQKKLRSLLQVETIKHEETVKVRKRVAEDFHDQVGNQLASITVLVQLIQAKLSNGNKEVDELLQKLGQFTKTLFTGTRDFIWSIDPKSDNVNEMLIYIRDFGEELFEFSEINFYVDTNDTFDAKMRLPVGWSRHVVFIFKEALTNSLKHANCQNVYLNFNVKEHNFVFELKDDGKGLNGYQEIDGQGMGLRNMKERAKKIRSHISIVSQNGDGTVVTLEGKIPPNTG